MNTYRKLSETAIYNIDNLDYDATYQNLRTPNKNIRSLEKSEKGHITCRFKRPNIFVEISPKGKMNIYYDRCDDVNKITRILWEQKLVVCDRFSIERDVPRTLKGVQEGLKASLDDLIEPELLQRLNYHNYILPTAPQKPSKRWLKEFATISQSLRRGSNTIEQLKRWRIQQSGS